MATEQKNDTRGTRKVRVGIVLSDKMDKTRVVGVEWKMPHWLYKRPVRRLTKFKAHDEENATRVGDRVMISETRPLSKDKRWRIVQVLEKAEVVDVAPEEVDTTLLAELTAKETPGEPTPENEAAASEEGKERGR
jgi:small subunit ribosomal protein S17